MNRDIIVPEDFAEWQRSNPTPEQQIEYFKKHDKIRMPYEMWNKFYVHSLEHVGFCCSSCISDEEYLGQPNFDDRCCCLSKAKEEK